MTLYEEVGERIRELRTEKNYTGERLGQLLGTSKGNISQLESGKVKQDLEVLLKISKLFNANFLWLAKGEGEKYLSDNPIPKDSDNNSLKVSERDKYENRIDQLLFTVRILSEKLGKRKVYQELSAFVSDECLNLSPKKVSNIILPLNSKFGYTQVRFRT